MTLRHRTGSPARPRVTSRIRAQRSPSAVLAPVLVAPVTHTPNRSSTSDESATGPAPLSSARQRALGAEVIASGGAAFPPVRLALVETVAPG